MTENKMTVDNMICRPKNGYHRILSLKSLFQRYSSFWTVFCKTVRLGKLRQEDAETKRINEVLAVFFNNISLRKAYNYSKQISFNKRLTYKVRITKAQLQ